MSDLCSMNDPKSKYAHADHIYIVLYLCLIFTIPQSNTFHVNNMQFPHYPFYLVFFQQNEIGQSHSCYV